MPGLLEQLFQFTSEVFNNPELTDAKIRENALAVLSDLKLKGLSLKNHIADELARLVFVKIQASAERKAVDEVAKATGANTGKKETGSSSASGEDEITRQAYVQLQSATERAMVQRIHSVKELGRLAKSIWVIHTPTIATPCVTDGKPTENLMAEEIMKDEKRKQLTLDRAHIIRDYLQAGGVLVVAYNQDQIRPTIVDGKTIKAGRTQEQLDIYEKLKKEYPAQIIDFPIDIKGRQAHLGLPDAEYPLNLIGATYVMEDTSQETFEMTNLGVQANDPRNDATWGVWMQNRSQDNKEVNSRMRLVFDFLEKAGLNQVLHDHAKKHDINSDQYMSLLGRYMDLRIHKEKGIGCQMQ